MRYFFNNRSENEAIFVYTVGYEETLPAHKYGPTTRSGYMLHYVQSGKGIFWSDGKEYLLQAGSFFFIEPGKVIQYQADTDDPWAYYWIGFKGTLVEKYLKRTIINSHHPVFTIWDGGDSIEDKMKEIIEISFISEDNDLLLNARLLEILYYLSTHYSAEDASVQKNKNVILTKALQLMRDNLDSNIQITEIAETLLIDRTYLHRIFKEYFGIGPKDYFTNLRLSKAKELLIQTDYPINVIAQSVGIDDPQNFSKLFKKKEGLSPRKYRLTNQNFS